jgi:hypothetical protein
MKKAISLLVACGLAAPALAGPPVDDVAPVLDVEAAAPALPGAFIDDLGDFCEAFDAGGATGDPRLLGIDHAWGYYWMTGAGDGTGTPGQQVIRQFDEDWNLVETYQQLTTTPVWGGRDLASIDSENLLLTGAESGELSTYVFDPSTQRLDLSQSVRDATAVVATIRALTYHPGRDTFFTKDFGSGIIEFDRDGFEVNFWFDPGISAYGAAYDPINDTIWFNAYCGPVGASPCIATGVTTPGTWLFEWDPDTGELTGRTVDMQNLVYGPPGFVGWIPGGMDIRMNGDQVVFVIANQGSPQDFATIVLGDGTDGCPGGGVVECYADCDGSETLDFFDFLCFQNEFAASTPYADCDDSGTHDFFDFLCFQNEFAAGCL